MWHLANCRAACETLQPRLRREARVPDASHIRAERAARTAALAAYSNLSPSHQHGDVDRPPHHRRALYFGSLLLAWWLIAAATGPDYYNYVVSWFATWPGKLVLLGYTWALMHHMLGGIRHLIWDTGLGFDLKTIDLLSWGIARRISDPDGAHLVLRLEPRGYLMVPMRTPLKIARQLGSAKEGTDHFWKQRVTAVANVFLGLFLVWLIASLVGADYTTVKLKLSNPLDRPRLARFDRLRNAAHASRHAGDH